MRAHLPPLPATLLFTSPLRPSPKLNHFRFSRPIKSHTAAARSRWGSGEEPSSNGRFEFGPEDDDLGGGKRSWWSDYDDDDEDELGLDEDDEFPVFKVFRAFGWMVPAIAISLILGTGPNAFIMALAVPLGQTVISLLFDKVWGWSVDSPKAKSRTKTRKKPFSRAANGTRSGMGRKERGPRRSGQSWAPWDRFDGGGDSKGQRFGGWDDLDRKTRANDYSTRTSGRGEEGSQEKPKTVKLSRVGRVRERPLLLRLLVAAFPFLGSWMRFLF